MLEEVGTCRNNNIMRGLFQICQKFLLLIGKITRLTYIEISVIFNLWTQGALLTLSSFVPVLVLLCNDDCKNHPYCTIFTIGYALLYVILFILLLVHYKLPFDKAFYLCVDDLQAIAEKTHLTYQIVNILIFIVGFLLIISANVVIALFIASK